MDIGLLTCKCDTKSCTDVGCNSACFSAVHISCDGRREKKIPAIELALIKDQGEKVGSTGPHQIEPVDLPETRRQLLQKVRQEKRRDDEKQNGE